MRKPKTNSKMFLLTIGPRPLHSPTLLRAFPPFTNNNLEESVLLGGLIFFTRFPRIPIQKVSKVKLPLIKVSGPIIRQAFPLISMKDCAATGRDDIQNSYYDDKSSYEQFQSSLMKDILGRLRALFMFLPEQPNQLKHIEWPSFQSTLKTAALTLVIVAFLIVALCSVDSALCYILAWLSRKSA